MNEQLNELKRRIIQLLSKEGRPLTTEYICSKLNLTKSLASLVLYKLLKEGTIRRVYTDNYDPTRPFDTASWVLEEDVSTTEEIIEVATERKGLKQAQLILSIPLSMLNQRLKLLNHYGALDFHDAYTHIIEVAKRELKIMCPIIDAYALYPLVTKIIGTKDLEVKILTEISKSRDVLYLLDSLKSRNVEIKDATRAVRYEGHERKTFGIHAKIVIADDEVALIGSFNLSRHHYLVNFDVGFMVYDKEIVRKLSSLFDELWNYVSAAE